MTRRRLRTECLAVAILAIVVTLPFVDVLFSDARFFVRDLTRYYYPTKKILRDVVRGGEFPYWNRFYSAGQPMAANPEYEVFYPPQWLILLPDYDLGYRLHIIVHIFIAAFGMYALLRAMRLRILAALFGAITFASGGVLLSYINLLPILFAVVWIPWIGWSLIRSLTEPSSARIAIAGLFMGMQALVGEPTTLLQTWASLLLVAAWVGWGKGRWRGMIRGLVIGAGIVAVGVCLGSVQLVTAADHVGDSARARPFSLSLVTTWSMHPARPLELLAPNLFGHLFGDRTYWGSGMYRNTASPFIYSIYLGLPVAVLAFAALLSRIRGRGLALLFLAGSYVLALGEHTPVYGFLYEIGLARTVRYPEKFIFPALFAIILLGSVGFDRILRKDAAVRRRTVAMLFALTVLSGILCVITFSPFGETLYRQVFGVRPGVELLNVVALVRIDWLVSLLRCAVAGVLISVAFTKRRNLWRAAIVLFLLFDLTPVGVGVLPRIDRTFFDRPALVSELKESGEDYRLFHEVDWYGRSDTARKYFGSGSNAYWVVRNGLFPMTPALWGCETVLERDYDKTALLPTLDLVDAMWQVRDAGQARWREIFGAMSNVRYRARYRSFDKEKERVRDDPQAVRPVEFIEMDLVPRYYVADQIVRLGSRDEFATRLIREKFSARVAFVDSDAFEPAAGKVVSVNESANDARIVVDAEGPTLLVASVTRHRYWSATVDGNPARLAPVNIAYQGVVLEKGRHEVVMKYRNPLVPPLALLSLFTLASCLVAAAIPRRRSVSRTITS